MTRTARYMLCVGILAILLSPNPKSACGQQEVRAVFRISKAFLAEITDRPIEADIPFCASVLKFRCSGEIHGEGTISIDLQTSGQQAVFEVIGRGNGQACVKGIRGPLVAYGSAWGPFTSSTLVQFDGRSFTHLQTSPAATVYGDVQRVTGRRDRRIGQVMGAGMLPMADKLVPRAVAQATPIANHYLRDFIEETADKIIARLNEKTPVEETVNRLFPETANWAFQMSADDQFLQAAYGPPDAPVPPLPEVPPRLQDIRLEAWLRSTSEEAKLLAELSRRPLARQLVQQYLESTLPELAALAEERTVDAADSWVVIRIGAPQAQ